MSSQRRLGLTALIVGVTIGVVAAIAIPHTKPSGRNARLGPPGVLRTAPARHNPSGYGFVQLRRRGPIRIEARATDPRGGPDWAVRVFHADRVVPPDDRRPDVNPVIGRDLCAQLGRIYRGRFGWLDAAGTFRPVAITTRGAPTTCGSRRPDLHGRPYFDVVVPITDPTKPEAHVKQVIAWGLAGSAARSIRLRLGSTAMTAPRTAHGAYVAIGPPQLRSDQVRATITYGGRDSRELPRPASATRGGIGNGLTLSGRAPDPNGGLPFALLSNANCISWGARLIDDDRYGAIDYELGTLQELRPGGAGSCSGPNNENLFKRFPVVLSYGSGSADVGSDPGAGRIARRTQKGITVVAGQAAPDVTAVTLATPRDVRTLIPGGPAHAVIAVYDGTFPTGGITLTARYMDGHTKTVHLSSLAGF